MPWLEKMGLVKAAPPDEPSKRVNYKKVCEDGVCRIVRTDEGDDEQDTTNNESKNETVQETGDGIEATGDAKKIQ